LKRNRKGVSEIIAVVLMILMVTTIGFGVYLYSLGYFTSLTSAREVAGNINIKTIREHFLIVDVNFTANYYGPNQWLVNATVYNYCNYNIEIVSMYLNGTKINVEGNPVSIKPYSYEFVKGPYFGDLGDNVPQLIRVVSSLGNVYENYYPS